jgi:hypothetical protein
MNPAKTVSCFLLVLATVLGAAGSEPVGYSRTPLLEDNMKIVASGDDFIIQAFVGAVLMEFDEEALRPGLAILHANTALGEASWLARGGTFALPTRRAFFVTRRVIGVREDGTYLYIATWSSGWLDQPPKLYAKLPSNEGSYYVHVFCLETGQRVLKRKLELTEGRPDQIPVETADSGVLQQAEKGVRIFGELICAETEEAICA